MTIPTPDHRSNPPAELTIRVPALDTREDWYDDYVDSVESASATEWTGDDSVYGVFRAADGSTYRAYVNPALSDDDEWVVELTRED